jgi:hypothetical protein
LAALKHGTAPRRVEPPCPLATPLGRWASPSLRRTIPLPHSSEHWKGVVYKMFEFFLTKINHLFYSKKNYIKIVKIKSFLKIFN